MAEQQSYVFQQPATSHGNGQRWKQFPNWVFFFPFYFPSLSSDGSSVATALTPGATQRSARRQLTGIFSCERFLWKSTEDVCEMLLLPWKWIRLTIMTSVSRNLATFSCDKGSLSPVWRRLFTNACTHFIQARSMLNWRVKLKCRGPQIMPNPPC